MSRTIIAGDLGCILPRVPAIIVRAGVAYAWLVPGELPGVNHGGLAYRFNAASGVRPTATYNPARAL